MPPRPVKRTAACFRANQARRHIGKERRNLIALQLLFQHRLASLIHSVDPQHVLCKRDGDLRQLCGSGATLSASCCCRRTRRQLLRGRGRVVFPAVFSFGLDAAQGPALAFVVLSEVFSAMAGGAWIGAAFFALLTIAALTSAVSLLEVTMAFAMHRFGWSRAKASLSLGGLIFVLGIPASLGFGPWAGIAFLGGTRNPGCDGLHRRRHPAANERPADRRLPGLGLESARRTGSLRTFRGPDGAAVAVQLALRGAAAGVAGLGAERPAGGKPGHRTVVASAGPSAGLDRRTD